KNSPRIQEDGLPCTPTKGCPDARRPWGGEPAWRADYSSVWGDGQAVALGTCPHLLGTWPLGTLPPWRHPAGRPSGGRPSGGRPSYTHPSAGDERHGSEPCSAGGEDRVRDSGRDRHDRSLAASRRRLFGPVKQQNVNRRQ